MMNWKHLRIENTGVYGVNISFWKFVLVTLRTLLPWRKRFQEASNEKTHLKKSYNKEKSKDGKNVFVSNKINAKKKKKTLKIWDFEQENFPDKTKFWRIIKSAIYNKIKCSKIVILIAWVLIINSLNAKVAIV